MSSIVIFALPQAHYVVSLEELCRAEWEPRVLGSGVIKALMVR